MYLTVNEQLMYYTIWQMWLYMITISAISCYICTAIL